MRAISAFSFDAGISTRRCFDPHALRIRVNMSAIGSVMLISQFLAPTVSPWGRVGIEVFANSRESGMGNRFPSRYQLLFVTPGIRPFRASSRKQRRQMPNFRRYARDRPQRWHRLCLRTANFGFRLDFSTMALRAIERSLKKVRYYGLSTVGCCRRVNDSRQS